MKMIERLIQSMGYRRPDPIADPDRWCKPLGYTFLLIFVSGNTASIAQHIRKFPGSSDPGGVYCHATRIIEDTNDAVSCLAAICDFEAFCLTEHQNTEHAPFSFRTKNEINNELCGVTQY